MSLDFLPKEEAEKLSGFKLDGRRKYFIWDGQVCVEEKYTLGCSGCMNDREYSNDTIGMGCHECGYTGKRRDSVPVPVKYIVKETKK